jgi:hypothetical protein
MQQRTTLQGSSQPAIRRALWLLSILTRATARGGWEVNSTLLSRPIAQPGAARAGRPSSVPTMGRDPMCPVVLSMVTIPSIVLRSLLRFGGRLERQLVGSCPPTTRNFICDLANLAWRRWRCFRGRNRFEETSSVSARSSSPRLGTRWQKNGYGVCGIRWRSFPKYVMRSVRPVQLVAEETWP